jgi:predicted Fe-Mo cluster-binding NifX family protein
MKEMKIAVPTNDGASIAEHFGRSAAFLIFETENGQIKSRELRSNNAQHSHGEGECHHHSAGEHPHSHAGILSTLDGCEIVICAGMGQRAVEALQSRGTQIIFAAHAPAEETIAAFLAGKLAPVTKGACRCSH